MVPDCIQFDIPILNGLIPSKVAARLDDGSGSRRGRCTEDIHNGVLESLSLFRIVIVAKDPMMVEDAKDVVRIHDASESAGFLKLKLVDQGVYNEL